MHSHIYLNSTESHLVGFVSEAKRLVSAPHDLTTDISIENGKVSVLFVAGS